MPLHVTLSPVNVDYKAMTAVLCHANIAQLLYHSVQADL